MPEISCVVLPSGRRFSVPTRDHTNVRLSVEEQFAALFDANPNSLDILYLDENVFYPLGECDWRDKIYVLPRYDAGGKGGFRKQLEKKGREFARAKAKEDNARRQLKSQKTPASKEVVSAAARKEVQQRSKTDTTEMRTLVVQGVEASLKKQCAKLLPPG